MELRLIIVHVYFFFPTHIKMVGCKRKQINPGGGEGFSDYVGLRVCATVLRCALTIYRYIDGSVIGTDQHVQIKNNGCFVLLLLLFCFVLFCFVFSQKIYPKKHQIWENTLTKGPHES